MTTETKETKKIGPTLKGHLIDTEQWELLAALSGGTQTPDIIRRAFFEACNKEDAVGATVAYDAMKCEIADQRIPQPERDAQAGDLAGDLLPHTARRDSMLHSMHDLRHKMLCDMVVAWQGAPEKMEPTPRYFGHLRHASANSAHKQDAIRHATSGFVSPARHLEALQMFADGYTVARSVSGEDAVLERAVLLSLANRYSQGTARALRLSAGLVIQKCPESIYALAGEQIEKVVQLHARATALEQHLSRSKAVTEAAPKKLGTYGLGVECASLTDIRVTVTLDMSGKRVSWDSDDGERFAVLDLGRAYHRELCEWCQANTDLQSSFRFLVNWTTPDDRRQSATPSCRY